MMKRIISILIFSWTNILVGQSLEINSGTDTIYLGAYNEIKIKTDIPNVIMQSDLGELRRIQDHYYRFKICDSLTTVIKLFLKNGKNNNLIKEFQFKVIKVNDPIIVPNFRNYPMGVRAIPKIQADLPFIVKEYKLEIIKKDGERKLYLNFGSELSPENYFTFRQLKSGDTYRIVDLIAFNTCEPKARILAPSDYYTIL